MQLQPHADPYAASARPGADGRRIGVLLCHGFTGSPASMVPWAKALEQHGYAVSVPRLPGHGTTWQEMNRTTWVDWYAEISAAFAALRAENDAVAVCGLSMGGGLALRLAEDRPEEVAGLVLVNPAVNIARWDVKLVPLVKHVLGAMPGIANDIKKTGVQEYGYDRTPLRAAHEMLRGYAGVRADLGRVTCPVLLFHSAEDHVVDPSSARLIADGVRGPFEERTLHDSYHVATLDNDAERIFAESADFIAQATSAKAGTPG